MKKRLLQFTALSGSLMASSAMAHGDHSVMTPSHGMEHALYYGLGFVALWLGHRMLKARKDK